MLLQLWHKGATKPEAAKQRPAACYAIIQQWETPILLEGYARE